MTAERWARRLVELGHEAVVDEEWRGERCDVLVGLHARKSFPSIERFRHAHPDAPLVVALTGTDLYADLGSSAAALAALELATRLVALQPAALAALPGHLRDKTRVIVQSAEPPVRREPPDLERFDVCVLAHLRPVKDPFRAAEAARLLPPSSRLRILQAGAPLSPDYAERARAEDTANPRYRFLGELAHEEALALLARSRLLALTSTLEGGANVVSEALACGVPVVSSRIPGSLGLLGEGYPGYFLAGDTAALAALFARAEGDTAFYRELGEWCGRLRPLVDPTRERETWAALLGELGVRSWEDPPHRRPNGATLESP